MAQKDKKKGSAEAASGAKAGAAPMSVVHALRACVIVAGLAWGATVAFAVSAMGWVPFGEMGGITVPGSVALAVGGVLAVVIAGGCLKQFGRRFAYIKPGQARMVRLVTFIVLGALAAFGAATLYHVASPENAVVTEEGVHWGGRIAGTEVFGQEFSVRPMLFPSLAVFLTVALVMYLLINRVLWSDFLIETEGELKKVSWPKRQEFVGSSAVVVVVVVVVSLFLFFADMALSEFMKRTGIGF